jgi:signal transduction histidine kinase
MQVKISPLSAESPDAAKLMPLGASAPDDSTLRSDVPPLSPASGVDLDGTVDVPHSVALDTFGMTLADRSDGPDNLPSLKLVDLPASPLDMTASDPQQSNRSQADDRRFDPAEAARPVAGHQRRSALQQQPELQQDLQQQVERQSRYQSLIRRLAMAIQGATDLSETLKMAAEGIAQVLDAEQGMILRMKYWDPRHSVRSSERIPKARVLIESRWSRHPAGVDLDESAEGIDAPIQPASANPASASANFNNVIELHRSKAAAPLSQSFWIADCALCQYAMTGGSDPIVFQDAPAFAETLSGPTIAPVLDPASWPALLMVPLESKNKVLGFITVQHAGPRTWQPAEVELAELMAAQLSSAIIQTETLRQVESLVEERTAQLQQSLELQAKLYEITRKQIEKLREMNQRMDEFLSTLSHELRTPLTSMMLAIRMLREAALPPDRRMQYLNILEQQCAQETSLINDLLALQELETKQVVMQVQKVNLQHVVEDLSAAFDQRWGVKGLTLVADLPAAPLVLSTDASSLQRVLLELLTNAGKYSDPNQPIKLTVAARTHEQVTISLTNTGTGIAAEELPHIFDKFRRGQGQTQQAVPGTGLGLALVKSLIQHLSGTVAVASSPIGDGPTHETVFTLTLPVLLDSTKGSLMA